jgi:hypothetical protein
LVAVLNVIGLRFGAEPAAKMQPLAKFLAQAFGQRLRCTPHLRVLAQVHQLILQSGLHGVKKELGVVVALHYCKAVAIAHKPRKFAKKRPMDGQNLLQLVHHVVGGI